MLSYDFQAEETVEAIVTEKFTNWTDFIVHISIGEEVIESTLSHPFWLSDSRMWIAASDLQAGMVLKNFKGENVAIDTVKIEQIVKNTYNFEVESLHTYFVGISAVLVHNDDHVSKFLSTETYNSHVYVITDIETGKVIYVGQSIQDTDVRLKQHLADPDSAVSQYLKKKNVDIYSPDFNYKDHLSKDTPVSNQKLTPYELSVLEQHYIDKHGGLKKDGGKLENKINAITEDKYKQYKNLHNPCR